MRLETKYKKKKKKKTTVNDTHTRRLNNMKQPMNH